MATNRDMMFYLGIDPGKSGALALYCPLFGEIELYDMPLKSDPVKKGRKIIDLYALATFIDNKRRLIRHAIVEKPNAFPGEGRTSAFQFGFACGVVQMLVASALIPMEIVTPGSWKPRMGVSRDKKETIEKAKKLFPNAVSQLTLAKHDGRAEALLMAHLLYKDLCDGHVNTYNPQIN